MSYSRRSTDQSNKRNWKKIPISIKTRKIEINQPKFEKQVNRSTPEREPNESCPKKETSRQRKMILESEETQGWILLVAKNRDVDQRLIDKQSTCLFRVPEVY